MDGTRIAWPARAAAALAIATGADDPHGSAIVWSLMRLVWGLGPDTRPAPAALVERAHGPAA
ncbi:MAG: hypothetical protein JO262_10945 [Solirubrobacterales bacterium]|nr:hypothetical protein [Solirubrobacterales bacterium]MBV9942634.1 hypothetical protein [Solirubrobacterales bacterium]